ncbi:hypothetical protein J4227_06330 [Candidatus Woesearchaeota archaeon]|nr:hypothetical protein [Candidatus Woesearchaeota archaeon]
MNCGAYSCGEGEYSGRQFLTTTEKAEMLENYKKWLEMERKGVEEAIAKLKKAK